MSDEEELARFGEAGPGAGQLKEPGGIAADPTTGYLFTADEGNNRISEFTPWGEFVKAFGFDVAPGPVNEQQEVRVRAAAGQFKISFGAGGPGVGETGSLNFNATATEVQGALNALTNISSGGGSVSVREVAGTTDGITPFIYVVSFTGGSLKETNVPTQIAVANGETPLSGGNPSTSLEARTRADGTAGGSGLESCTEESGCKAGLKGAGAGELGGAFGVAVDAGGDVYVREFANNRVEKFDSAGRFLLMFGGEVDKTTGADVCSREDVEVHGDVCGAGTEGSGTGEFFKDFDLALGSGGTVFVPDKERIGEFEADGSFKGEVKVPGEFVRRLAVNPKSGGFYAVFATSLANIAPKDNVRVLSAAGGVEGSCGAKHPEALASDAAGDLYAVSGENTLSEVQRVIEFEAGCGKKIAELAEAEPLPGNSANHFTLSGLGTNLAGDLYVANASPSVNSFIRAFGPGPVIFEAPPKVPPSIEAQFAVSVTRKEASVGALINPHFFTDTRYLVQYGSGKCSEGGCAEEKPLPPGALLSTKATGVPVKSAPVLLEGLSPGTTYHYRFVAQSGGGGPVAGGEATFTTFPEALPKQACPNEAFRGGFSALLPDCRAYEMVSPVDKNSGDIKALIDGTGYATNLALSSADGEKLSYSSYRSFGEPEGAPYTNQYIATRDAGAGWSSEAIDVPQSSAATALFNTENEYKSFSADLCSGWLMVAAEPPLAAGASPGFIDLYRRDNCGEEGYEALIGVKPNVVEPRFFRPELQGSSADGKAAVVRAKDLPGAPSGLWRAYFASAGQLQAICVLPDGTASGGNCSAGTASDEIEFPELHRLASVSHAISADGSKVYWTASAGVGVSGAGKVYLRENPGQEQSALSGEECSEAEKACTIKVSETESSKAARFLGASADGSKALFEVTEGAKEGNLYEFSVGAGSSEIAAKVLGVAGAGEDLSYVYFVSEEALGGGAEAGKPNLYLYHEGATSFIARLSGTDVVGSKVGLGAIPSDTAAEAVYHAARASADGRVLSFISTESLGGYDNTDAASPLACGVKEGAKEGVCDSEVYRYEAGAAGAVCVSCDPSGAQPQGRAVQGTANSARSLATAASIPAANYDLGAPRSLSGNGQRLFFDSYDALLARDSNGKEDVYEWEAAASAKACEEKGAELYVEASGGCLSLISSGTSASDSEFLDANPDGHDAFFATNTSLLASDPGLFDVYDARVGGGIPEAGEPVICQGEACQPPASAPPAQTPSSSTYIGPGNETPKKKPPHKKHHHHKKKKKRQSRRTDR